MARAGFLALNECKGHELLQPLQRNIRGLQFCAMGVMEGTCSSERRSAGGATRGLPRELGRLEALGLSLEVRGRSSMSSSLSGCWRMGM
jgi:hypothetical protein